MQESSINSNFINFINFPNEYVDILKQAAILTLKSNKKRKYQINFIMISDKEIKSLNTKYRKTRRITDVISFLVIPEKFVGDIYISNNRTKKQAKRYNNTWQEELSYLIIHGILHLCGYTDYDVKNKIKMFTKQDKIFKCLFSRG
jgi:probable rRNA maturation factor